MNGPDAPDPNPTGAFSAVGETILRRFRVEKVLGRGGMGEVLLAHDTVLNRRVALKRLRSDGAAGPTRRNAILKEARRASQVTDHRIAAIYDVLDLDQDVLIVMEYVDGRTLRERMTAPLPIAEFWGIATQCAEALGAAHASGIIHRDIKPENLMLTGNGQIKILDFGIARRPDAPAGAEGVNPTLLTTLTAEGHAPDIAGTPQYMSPEALYGGRLDPRTDIYSLGTVFYELLAGRNPFAGPDLRSVLERVMTVHPPPVNELRPEVGAATAAVITRMMAKDPAQREASCEEVVRELTSARSADAAAEAPSRPRRTGAWRLAGITAAIAAVVATSFGVWRTTAARALPRDRNLAVLAPVTTGGREEFASFAVGTIDLLHSRLQKHQDRPGFQVAPFQEVLDEKVLTSADARRVQGATLALLSTLEETSGRFRARLELWDTKRGAVIASRTIDTPVDRPYQFVDGLHTNALALLGLTARGAGTSAEYGIRGAGTLRFFLQGIGRLRTATNLDQTLRAVEDLELACRAEPEAGVARAWLGAAQRRCFPLSRDRSWLDRAEISVREAISRDSSRAEGHRFLGLVLAMKGDTLDALQAFARGCALDPTNDEAHSRLGRTYGLANAAEDERDTYLSVIARRPHCWQPYWWLASWRYRQGDIEGAIQSWREVVRRAPALYRGYANLGGLLVLRGDYDAAVDTLKLALMLHPTKTAFDNLGTAYFNSGNPEATEAYNQSIQFGFSDYDSWLNLGDAYYFLRNRRDQAVDAYAQAIRLGREKILERAQAHRSFDVEIPANLSTVFPKLDQPDSARRYLRTALVADSSHMQVLYCAALVHWQLGEKDLALAWLSRAVAAGYSRTWLRDSPVFKEWRDQAAFRALAQEIPQRSHVPSSLN